MENKNQRVNTLIKYNKPGNWKEALIQFATFAAIVLLWEFIARSIAIPLIWPSAGSIGKAIAASVMDSTVMVNFAITLSRVLKGWGIAMIVGVPVGMAMGLSKTFNAMFGGVVNALRQVPMMAWVPLTIIWFGIGDGPTLFMIALNGIFQVVLNTAQGVQGISKDYFNAARSMGAGKWSVFKNIVVPSSIPDILVGARLAVGGGWMSVI